MRSSPFRNALWTVTAVLTLMLTRATPAQAGQSSGSSEGDPDNANHYIDKNSLTSGGHTATNHGIASPSARRAGHLQASTA